MSGLSLRLQAFWSTLPDAFVPAASASANLRKPRWTSNFETFYIRAVQD
jgi:hypothetical protein